MTTRIDGGRYDAITFDCYGTLIDWESGMLGYFRPLLETHDAHAVDSFLLDFYGRTEANLQAGAYRSYRQILEDVVKALGERLGFAPSADAVSGFPDSIRDWMPFPDTVAALKALAPNFRRAIISNIDDDLFALTQARLDIPFDHVVTAAQVGAYKPDPRPFEAAIERLGVPKGRILHVAQSLYHDIAPANALGLDTVWIDRHAGDGSGATPAAEATPKWSLGSLGELVDALS